MLDIIPILLCTCVYVHVCVYMYSQIWLESHCLQHQSLYNNTHVGNCVNGLCTKCLGYNNNLVITAHLSGTKGVIVNKFDCICVCVCVCVCVLCMQVCIIYVYTCFGT